jgi:type IV secretory pathway VirJ component
MNTEKCILIVPSLFGVFGVFGGLFLPIILFCCSLGAHAQDPTGVEVRDTHQETFEFGRFGTVHIYVPKKIQSVAIFAAGDGGWNEGINDMVQLLANQGALVAGIDTPHYLAELATSKEACAYPAGEFEDLAHAVEKKYGVQTYFVPTLVGYSSGASLAYIASAQAPKGTFRGLITLGFCDEWASPKDLCRGRDLRTKKIKDAFALQPAADVGLTWVALQGASDQACSLESLQAFARNMTGAKVEVLPKVGHGYAVGREWHAQYVAAYGKLAAPMPSPQLPQSVRDLPLIEVPASRGSDTFALMLTGDGGWAGLDREVAAGLASAGIPVVALSSLQYFWKPRTPEQAAQDTARIIDHYATAWRREHVVLVGYSFGADALPSIINRLPQEARARIARVALIGLAPKASFEIHVGGWLGRSGDQPVLPELERLARDKIDIMCIRGADETDSLCPLPPTIGTSVVLKGGHHFNGDYSAVVDAIVGSAK